VIRLFDKPFITMNTMTTFFMFIWNVSSKKRKKLRFLDFPKNAKSIFKLRKQSASRLWGAVSRLWKSRDDCVLDDAEWKNQTAWPRKSWGQESLGEIWKSFSLSGRHANCSGQKPMENNNKVGNWPPSYLEMAVEMVSMCTVGFVNKKEGPQNNKQHFKCCAVNNIYLVHNNELSSVKYK